MPFPPAVAAVLADEDRRRSLAWLALPEPLLGSPARLLTLRMEMELRLVRCAFFTGRAPLWGDVFVYLWRLHPAYYRPASLRRYYDWPACAALRRHVQRLAAAPGEPLAAAEAAIRDHIRTAYLDAPAQDPAAPPPSPLEPRAHLVDSLVHWAAGHYGWAPDFTLDQPLARLFQLRRAATLAAGGDVVDPVHDQIQRLLTPSAP